MSTQMLKTPNFGKVRNSGSTNKALKYLQNIKAKNRASELGGITL